MSSSGDKVLLTLCTIVESAFVLTFDFLDAFQKPEDVVWQFKSRSCLSGWYLYKRACRLPRERRWGQRAGLSLGILPLFTCSA